MINEKVASATTNAEKRAAEGKVALLAAWAHIMGEYASRVLAVRIEFYRNSVKDPVAAKMNQKMYEEDSYRPANESLDARARQIDGLHETQLMKAFALAASNAVKRGKGGGKSDEK